jgi:hypothetical protein
MSAVLAIGAEDFRLWSAACRGDESRAKVALAGEVSQPSRIVPGMAGAFRWTSAGRARAHDRRSSAGLSRAWSGIAIVNRSDSILYRHRYLLPVTLARLFSSLPNRQNSLAPNHPTFLALIRFTVLVAPLDMPRKRRNKTFRENADPDEGAACEEIRWRASRRCSETQKSSAKWRGAR